MADFINGLTGTAQLPNSEVLLFDQMVMIGIGQNNVMDQFATYEESIGAKSIQLTKYPRSAASITPLNEREEVDSTQLSDSKVLFVPQEFGHVVSLSNLELLQSGGKALRGASQTVALNAAQTLDLLAIEALSASTNTIVAGGASAPTATDVANVKFLNKVYNKLARASVPTIGGAYVAVLHDDQIADLRDDARWVDVQKYANAESVLRNEVGMLGGFRIVRDNHVKAAGTGATTAYTGLFFGQNALGKVASQPVSTIIKPADDKLGRFTNVGWYGVLNYGIVDQDCVYTGVTASSVNA